MQSTLPTTTDVLVVGAGPVGLALATSLSARGIGVVLVDRQAEGANTSRACVVHARTLEVLAGIDVTGELIRRGRVVPRLTVRDRDHVLLTVDFDGLPTEHPYTLMVPQNVTEEVLLDRLTRAGGVVHRPYELARLEQDATGVTATMATGERVRARYAVGADGMHSAVREQAGIGFAGASYAQSFVLADVRMDWAESDREVMLYFSAEGVTVIAPLPEDGRYRIVATAESAPERPGLAFVQGVLDARGPRRHPAVVHETIWTSRFRVHHRLAEHYRSGRVFLAGDAAHVHSPAGGQGMNTGIQDALHLAATLAAVLSGGPEELLDSYEAERRPVAAQVVAFTDRMTRMATMRSRVLRGLRNALLRVLGRVPAVRRALAVNLAELRVTRRA